MQCPLHVWAEGHPALTLSCHLPGLYEGFEGLQAEECGILNGCENGRCVRVREGYTCDCFDGFQLDMTRMACVGEWRLGPAWGQPRAVWAAWARHPLAAAALWWCRPGQLLKEPLLLSLVLHPVELGALSWSSLATCCWQLSQLIAPFFR